MNNTTVEKLKGKPILVGKEPINGRLCISVTVKGQLKTAAIGNPKSVPSSVSRCKPSEGMAHCRIDVNDDGSMLITNLKPANVTCVGGMQVETKRIDETSTVTLGADMYLLDITNVLKAAEKIVDSVPKEYSVAHLEKVWNDYDNGKKQIRESQQKYSKLRMLPIMLGSFSGILAPILGKNNESTLYITVPIAVISFSLYFILFRRKDTSAEDLEALQSKLREKYVCPNPDCHRPLVQYQYKQLINMKKCPHCGSIFKE